MGFDDAGDVRRTPTVDGMAAAGPDIAVCVGFSSTSTGESSVALSSFSAVAASQPASAGTKRTADSEVPGAAAADGAVASVEDCAAKEVSSLSFSDKLLQKWRGWKARRVAAQPAKDAADQAFST